MIEAKILNGFLDKLTEDAIKYIENGGSLNHQNALPFLIKDQYSKISHIEEDFVTRGDLYDFKQFTIDKFVEVDQRFKEIDKRFENINKQFYGLYALITIGFTALAFLGK